MPAILFSSSAIQGPSQVTKDQLCKHQKRPNQLPSRYPVAKKSAGKGNQAHSHHR
jgi:hypothetical protein